MQRLQLALSTIGAIAIEVIIIGMCYKFRQRKKGTQPPIAVLQGGSPSEYGLITAFHLDALRQKVTRLEEQVSALEKKHDEMQRLI